MDMAATDAIDGVFNLRTIGGFAVDGGATVRPDLVFRADGIHRTAAAGRLRIYEIGVRTVIDLRSPFELETEGRYDHAGVDLHHIAIVEDLATLMRDEAARQSDDPLRLHYAKMIGENGGAFGSGLRLVAESVEAGRPALFHCTAGKDRTGVLTALLLSGLGVDRAAIATDYAASAESMRQLIAWFRANGTDTPEQRMSEMGVDPSMAEALTGAREATMLGFLDDVDASHGGVDALLATIGAEDAMSSLRRTLLTSASGRYRT